MGRDLTKVETDIVNTDLEIEVLLKMVDIKRDHMVQLHRRLYAEMEPREEVGDTGGEGEDPPVDPSPSPETRRVLTGFWGVESIQSSGQGWTEFRFIHTGEGSAISSKWMKPGPLEDINFLDCIIEGTGHNYWGMRVYDIGDMELRDCLLHHLGHYAEKTYEGNAPGKFEGHAIYPNVWGNLRVINCGFEDCLGQALQVVWREHESVIENKERRGQGEILVKGCDAKDMAKHADRGSFCYSFFNPGQEIVLEDTTYTATDSFPLWVDKYGQERGSRGALCVVRGQTWNSQTPKLTVRNFRASLLKDRGAAVKLQNVLDVDWAGGHLEDRGGAPVRVDIFPDCPKGQIKGVEGDYEIYRVDQNGKNGTLVAKNRDYEWAT